MKARSRAIGYLVAVASVLFAIWLRFAFGLALGSNSPYPTFLVAVAVSAWFGAGPATLAMLAGLVSAVYFFIPPLHSFFIQDPGKWPGVAMYLFVSTVLILLGETQRSARERNLRNIEALELKEEHLSTTLRSIGDAVITTDALGSITFLNAAAERLTGWTSSEAMGLPSGEVFHIINEQSRAEVESPIQRVIATGMMVGLANHTCLITRDGTEVPIDDSGAPIRGTNGALQGVVLVFRDISDRRRADAAVKEAQRKLTFLAEASAVLSSSLDHEETLATVAALAVRELADWCIIDIVEENGELRQVALAHPDPEKIAWSKSLPSRPPDANSPRGLQKVLRTGTPELYEDIPDSLLVESARDEEELAILRQAGLCSAMILPLLAQGQPLGGLSLLTAESGRHFTHADLAFASELASRAAVAIANARLYRAARDADQRKDQFLAMLAHELRNPLAPILYSVEILRSRSEDNPSIRADTVVQRQQEIIERQVRQMARLTDDLLDVSRISRNATSIRHEILNLTELVRRTAEDHRTLLENSGVELLIDLPDAPLWIDGDSVRLAQVLGNLLHNAAKFTNRGGEVRIRLLHVGPDAVLAVADTGIGIEKPMLPHIFEAFTQADRSLDRSRGGLGLGLALVKGLVELHGGHVQARSGGPGCGSEFIVTIPVSERAATGVSPPHDIENAPACRRVLIVEDNTDAAENLRDLLSLWGHEARWAATGAEGIRLAEAFNPEVILLDIGLPEMDGYEVARRLRGQPTLQNALIIALTGYGQSEDRDRSKEAGFDHHLVKPVDPENLRALISARPEPAVDSKADGQPG